MILWLLDSIGNRIVPFARCILVETANDSDVRSAGEKEAGENGGILIRKG